MSFSRRIAAATLSIAAASSIVAGAAQPAAANPAVSAGLALIEGAASLLPQVKCSDLNSNEAFKLLPPGIPRDQAEFAVAGALRAKISTSLGYKVTLNGAEQASVNRISKLVVNKAVECGYVNSQDTSGVISSGFSS